MSCWKVKRGNTSIQEVPVYDKEGAEVTNLAAATDIIFQVKESKAAASALIEKTKSDMGIDDPSTGYLKITLEPDDTAINPGSYVMAIEIKWSPTLKYETILTIDGEETEVFEVEEDIIKTTP